MILVPSGSCITFARVQLRFFPQIVPIFQVWLYDRVNYSFQQEISFNLRVAHASHRIVEICRKWTIWSLTFFEKLVLSSIYVTSDCHLLTIIERQLLARMSAVLIWSQTALTLNRRALDDSYIPSSPIILINSDLPISWACFLHSWGGRSSWLYCV